MQGIPWLHYGRAQNDFSTYRECADEYRQVVESLRWNLKIVEAQHTGYSYRNTASCVSGLEFVSKEASLDGRVWTHFHVFHS